MIHTHTHGETLRLTTREEASISCFLWKCLQRVHDEQCAIQVFYFHAHYFSFRSWLLFWLLFLLLFLLLPSRPFSAPVDFSNRQLWLFTPIANTFEPEVIRASRARAPSQCQSAVMRCRRLEEHTHIPTFILKAGS